MKRSSLILAGGVLLLFGVTATTGIAVPGQNLSLADVQSLARQTLARNVFGGERIISRQVLVRIAWIESRFNPTAVRSEIHLGDASIGLMQTLTRTAKWLEADTRFSRGRGVSAADLFDPAISMYYAAAYLHRTRLVELGGGASEEMLVRAYNTGPGNWNSPAGAAYWRKYQQAIQEVG